MKRIERYYVTFDSVNRRYVVLDSKDDGEVFASSVQQIAQDFCTARNAIERRELERRQALARASGRPL